MFLRQTSSLLTARRILRPACIAPISALFTASILSTFCRYASSSSAAADADKNKDYYSILGIPKDAPKDQIKKAYRKRAMETHPDQGGKLQEFQDVGEAYEILSNEDKRQIFDKYGSEAAQQGFGGMGAGGHRSPEDIFNEFFSGMGMNMGMKMGGSGKSRQMKVEDLEVTLDLTLEEYYSGITKPVKVTRPKVCSVCKGNGTKSGKPKPACVNCNGRGQRVDMQNMGGGIIQTITECRGCNGTGNATRADDRCSTCYGKGYKNENVEIPIPIQAGTPPNVTLRVAGEGGSIPGATSGDLIIRLNQKPHKVFIRKGNDLLMNLDISFSEALLGFEHNTTLIDGRTVCIQSQPNEILQSNSVLKLTGEGMVKPHGSRGDLYITVKIKMPKTLSPHQREALEKVFEKPKNSIPGKVNPTAMISQNGNATDSQDINNTNEYSLSTDMESSCGKASTVVKARVLKQTKEEFMSKKQQEWDQEAGAYGRGAGDRGGGGQEAKFNGGFGGQEAQCVHQ